MAGGKASSAIGLRRVRPPSLSRLAACFAIGALLGTSLDAIHVAGDVLVYHGATIAGMGWWVPLQFGVVGVAAGLAVPALERAAGPPEPPRWGADRLVGELVLFAALYELTALAGPDDAGLLAVALFALAGARLALAPTRGDWIYVVVAAVLGPLGEGLVSATGVFEYLHPDVIGVPWWLAGLWANGGLLIRRLFVPVVSRA
jgi:hypothetical protein